MKLGTKIALGFTAVLATGAVLGTVSVITMHASVDRSLALSTRYVPKADLAVDIERRTAAMMLQARSFMMALSGSIESISQCPSKKK